MTTIAPMRGEIYYADLGYMPGSEEGGRRPVLIIQNDVGNQHSPTVIVAPVTGKPKRPLPTHVPLYPKGTGLTKPSTAMLEQIRVLDKGRLRGYIGEVDYPTMQDINKAISCSLGLL